MNKVCAGALIAACAVAVTLFAVRTTPPAEAQAQVVVKGPQWEYKVVDLASIGINAQNPNALNAGQLSLNFTKLADDGWEYIRDLNTGGYSVFKRAKR
jgi:uncharacterized protein involved in exopolysaccharide biosynthesis